MMSNQQSATPALHPQRGASVDNQQSLTAARVLAVDDEAPIRFAAVRALTLNRYQADEAGSGAEALHHLSRTPYDVMLLDMQMPGLNGIEVMQRARAIQPELLIIVLTGHATLESAMAAVKAGAVDYLLKPASLHDIVAAVDQALQARQHQVQRQQLMKVVSAAVDMLRQTQPPPAPRLTPPGEPWPDRFLRVGPLLLDRRKRLVIIEQALPGTIELTEGEALILAGLMTQPDEVLTCRQLARAAWDYDLIESEAQSVVRPYIFRLRHKFETAPITADLIHTLRGRGYLLVTPPIAPPET
jgi:DNA-binding response OmpR family regulator